MVLLDTNICIFLLNQRSGYERILEHLDGLDRDQVVISAITEAELQFGVAGSHQRKMDKNRARLEMFLAVFEIMPFASAAAAAYGNVRVYLQAKGTPIGPLDALIAGHALALDATLITNNLGEFRRVRGLTAEDWSV